MQHQDRPKVFVNGELTLTNLIQPCQRNPAHPGDYEGAVIPCPKARRTDWNMTNGFEVVSEAAGKNCTKIGVQRLSAFGSGFLALGTRIMRQNEEETCH
jgi:hypothetical protein